MKQTNTTIFILLITLFSFTACSKKSNVKFKGERALNEKQRSIERIISSTGTIQNENGGIVNKETTNGYRVHTYIGNNLQGKQGTTTNNYKVEYNIQMQMVQ